jgi:uncharacterized protein
MHGHRFAAVVLAFALALAAHLFVASWFMRALPSQRLHRRSVVVVAVALSAVSALGRFAAVAWPSRAVEVLAAGGAVESMIVMGGAIPLALMTLLARLAFGARAARVDPPCASELAGVRGSGKEVRPVTRRDVVEGIAGTLALGASTAALGWGAIRGRHAFQIEEVPVRILGLPPALDGYTIAQISDLHAGVFVGDRELGEGLSLVGSMRPDLVVVTGDLVDFDARYAPRLAGELGRLRTRDGVFAVLGNHDYYSDPKAVALAMRSAGVGLLVNEGRTIRPADGGGFALLGVDDLFATRWHGAGPDLDRALAMVSPDAPRVLLAHQPTYFDVVSGRVALQLSGHTHGGQINPGFRPGEWFTRYLAGRYERRGSTLWVNRGFGVVGPPSRIGAPPEVTKIVLVAA